MACAELFSTDPLLKLCQGRQSINKNKNATSKVPCFISVGDQKMNQRPQFIASSLTIGIISVSMLGDVDVRSVR
ncbi:MAG: hypothetical protein EoVTN8_1492 [Fluviibacter phosphoraccumulans EoVTN8]